MSTDELNEQQAASSDCTQVQDGNLDSVSGGVGNNFSKTCFKCGQPLKPKSRKCPNCGFELPSRSM